MRNLLLTTLVLVGACAPRSDAGRTNDPSKPRSPQVETWTLRFDPALEAPGGLGQDGLVWTEVVMTVSIDLGADDLAGTSTWAYSDTPMRADATLAGTRTGAHVQLTMRDARGGDFLSLEGDEQGGQVVGTATLTAQGPTLRQTPPWQGRFTMARATAPPGP